MKLQWKPKKSTEAPFVVDVPDVFTQAFVMEKDSKRFPKTGGWGYAVFNYEAPSDKFTADPKSLSDCGYTCQVAVKAKDYIFHLVREALSRATTRSSSARRSSGIHRAVFSFSGSLHPVPFSLYPVSASHMGIPGRRFTQEKSGAARGLH